MAPEPDVVDSAAPQWVPSAADIENARVTDFAAFVRRETGAAAGTYQELWQWSVEDLDTFWRLLWDYFDVVGSRPDVALADDRMPGARWFPGAELNFVDQVLRNARSDRPAIVHVTEGDGPDVELSWDELTHQIGAFAQTLRELGVQRGDRVVGYLPNIPEAVVAFLATASLGAVWSVCGQDYTASAALNRLGQLDPVVLVAADGYIFDGKTHDKRDEITSVQASLPSLKATVLVSRISVPEPDSATVDWDGAVAGRNDCRPVRVPFDHPLWVLYSSGTTGKPKGIVHGHGGVLLEHLKAIALQSDIGGDDTFFWYTSPSWMMWNFQVSGLLAGATIICYAGSPAAPQKDSLWQIASRVGATVFGTSPGYVLACEKAGAVPKREHDLRRLRAVGITGSTLPRSSSMWLRDNVGDHIPVFSISGGTDVVSAFIGGVRTVPVWPGEISVPYLGAALDSFDLQGNPVRSSVGELVLTKPMPSMPVCFWNDADGHRYRDAYFDTYPGVWRHGDWITITERGTIVMHGRSDSTLNRNGIRMGSADIYEAVERLPEVSEALVIGAEQPDGGYWMPLFVALAPGANLDADLENRIKKTIRENASPRHIPDDIIAAPGVPHTRSGKKLEVPIKRLIQGEDPANVVDRNAVDAPELIDWFAAQRRG